MSVNVNDADDCVVQVKWSAEDNAFVGSIPGVLIGGCCHGDYAVDVYDKLIEIILTLDKESLDKLCALYAAKRARQETPREEGRP